MPGTGRDGLRYSLPLRLLHWTRAALVIGMIAAGWLMTSLADAVPWKYGTLYPTHKSFGLLVLGLVVVQIAIRLSTGLPPCASALDAWEARLSKLVHGAMYMLLVAVPLMGYAMSSSYSQSDGVTFFGFPVPELLAKDDTRFAIFQSLHRILAYTLLAMVGLHVAGVVKHRYFDRRPGSDVLARML
ncbi:cytochrome b [Sphingomonas sp. RRHST34]|uniref:Cytochrome b n=1 Tax=Sphingomonas citri TaxID=2862499 RepID=A0ABS7BU69_9SPHN|nr:cytochrome b [Sphingomonas citri]